MCVCVRVEAFEPICLPCQRVWVCVRVDDFFFVYGAACVCVCAPNTWLSKSGCNLRWANRKWSCRQTWLCITNHRSWLAPQGDIQLRLVYLERCVCVCVWGCVSSSFSVFSSLPILCSFSWGAQSALIVSSHLVGWAGVAAEGGDCTVVTSQPYRSPDGLFKVTASVPTSPCIEHFATFSIYRPPRPRPRPIIIIKELDVSLLTMWCL